MRTCLHRGKKSSFVCAEAAATVSLWGSIYCILLFLPTAFCHFFLLIYARHCSRYCRFVFLVSLLHILCSGFCVRLSMASSTVVFGKGFAKMFLSGPWLCLDSRSACSHSENYIRVLEDFKIFLWFPTISPITAMLLEKK